MTVFVDIHTGELYSTDEYHEMRRSEFNYQYNEPANRREFCEKNGLDYDENQFEFALAYHYRRYYEYIHGLVRAALDGIVEGEITLKLGTE